MAIKVEQKSLFAEKSSSLKAEPALKAQASPKQFPSLDLLSGLNSSDLKSESVYWLRILLNQYIRQGGEKAQKAYLQALQAELKLKQGISNPETLLRTEILKKNIKK